MISNGQHVTRHDQLHRQLDLVNKDFGKTMQLLHYLIMSLCDGKIIYFESSNSCLKS